VPYSLIILPILLVGIGVFFVHANDLRIDPDVSMERFWTGLLFTVSSIAMWAWYAVNNAQYLKSQKDLNFVDFNIIIGVWCLLLSVVSMVFMAIVPMEQFHLTSSSLTSNELTWFLIAAILLGFFGSYMGTFFWFRASKMLPVTLAGQIIVAETCCGLLYTYIYQQRLPMLYEVIGFVLVVSGVLISLRRIQQYQLQKAALTT
nr:Inner membrane protein YtfF [Chlamydiota bacterium]